MAALQGKVCLVTGAARGIGRGIALQLGAAGATVYITGRTESNLKDCAAEIKDRGGKPVTVQLDHGNDSEVANLFSRIQTDEKGQLDVLVNNAYAGVDTIFSNARKKFYDTEPAQVWDTINGVGLRGHYICTTHASRIMTENRNGLIVNVSSAGGLSYLFNVAYGIGKAGCDRMAADCAVELKDKNVTMVSLWPGPVKTEFIEEKVLGNDRNPLQKMFQNAETVEFSGKAIVALAADEKKIKKTGKILMTADLSDEYGFKDEGGAIPINFRSLNFLLASAGWHKTAGLLPSSAKLPHWILHLGSNKF